MRPCNTAPMTSRSPRPGEIVSCGGCTVTWKGVGAAHCGACHLTFSSTKWFDRHRRLGRCIEPIDIRDAQGYQVLRQVDGMWRGPEIEDWARDRLRQ